MTNAILKRFDLSGKSAAVIGGGGDLCGHMVEALGAMGVKVAVVDISLEKAKARAQSVTRAGGAAEAYRCDILNVDQLRGCYDAVCRQWGPPDLLINGAGGNDPRGSTSDEFHEPGEPLDPEGKSFFDLEPAGFR
ncbi:MAG: SDR family NAD(P)-dependent oxidoreductase, partial [Syntrophobacteraceae bacterium]|nr:SDR family NAD(P)-dependent oxidoreductase [Syntrophobacteraceae bacterium]